MLRDLLVGTELLDYFPETAKQPTVAEFVRFVHNVRIRSFRHEPRRTLPSSARTEKVLRS